MIDIMAQRMARATAPINNKVFLPKRSTIVPAIKGDIVNIIPEIIVKYLAFSGDVISKNIYVENKTTALIPDNY